MTFNEWQRLVENLIEEREANTWLLADALAYGELHFRREYGPALERIYARQSLKNLASISRRVPVTVRRESLSFTHHAEVAALEQDWQKVWLDDAETHGWSTLELRARIAEWRGLDRGVTPALTIRAVADLRELCVRAAERLGQDPAEWAKQTLEQAARHVLLAESA